MTAPLVPVATGALARSSAALGARAALVRLVRRAGVLVAVAAIGLAAIAGALERRATAAQAVDRALVSVFELVIPLATFALVAAVIGRRRLEQGGWQLARFGADRRFLALGQIATAAGVSAVVAALAAAAAVVTAHGPTSAPLLGEALTSAWIGALTACAYTGWFALGATFLRAGSGRFVVLVADFVAGDVGLLAWVLPSGLAKNLLGLILNDLPQRGASATLALTALATAGLAAMRCGR